MLVASIAFLVIVLILAFTVVWNKRHPVDVSATPRLSDEEQQKQIDGPINCRNAGGVPYYEGGKYLACRIKKNVSHN